MARSKSEKCKKHQRAYCTDYWCGINYYDSDDDSSSGSSSSYTSSSHHDNAGSVSVNTDGGLSIGLGGGLAIDPSDGSIGVQIGGITIDFG